MEPAPIHIGGCINNRSPKDMHGDNCDCFKIRFTVCAWLKYQPIVMCREWVRYVASSSDRDIRKGDITSSVVTKAVCDYFNVTAQSHVVRSIKPKSKAVIDAVAPLGYIPEYFREVVMCNRYGYVENFIPVRWILTEAPQGPPYMGVYGRRNEQLWQQNTWGYELVLHNIDLYERFICALYNLASNKTLTKYKGCCLSYGMNPLQAAVKLLELKTKHHEADK